MARSRNFEKSRKCLDDKLMYRRFRRLLVSALMASQDFSRATTGDVVDDEVNYERRQRIILTGGSVPCTIEFLDGTAHIIPELVA